MITAERVGIVWYAPERARTVPRQVQGLVKAWTFGGAGPAEAWLMALWTEINWTVKLGMCLAFGHPQDNSFSDDEPKPYCERCGKIYPVQEEDLQ